LIRQDPATRLFHRIGLLTYDADRGYAFTYLDEALEEPGFEPLIQFPNVEGPNEFHDLPPFFQNRVLTSERENYNEYLGWIGLDEDSANLPMEFMARTGGARATDTFHLVQKPPIGPGLFSRFFISSLRHLDPDGELIKVLSDGDVLLATDEKSWERTPPAVVLLTPDGKRLGHVPEWLVDEVHGLIEAGNELVYRVERVNPDAPHHLRVLGRIEIVG
jgi:hypothetical protein